MRSIGWWRLWSDCWRTGRGWRCDAALRHWKALSVCQWVTSGALKASPALFPSNASNTKTDVKSPETLLEAVHAGMLLALNAGRTTRWFREKQRNLVVNENKKGNVFSKVSQNKKLGQKLKAELAEYSPETAFRN